MLAPRKTNDFDNFIAFNPHNQMVSPRNIPYNQLQNYQSNASPYKIPGNPERHQYHLPYSAHPTESATPENQWSVLPALHGTNLRG